MLAFLCGSWAASSLGTQPTTPYSHGGPYVADAGLPPGVQAWYVDALAGSDSNDGRSPDRAWKTAKKALNLDYAPGSMVLFKRGTRHDGGAGSDSVGSPSPNTEQAPFVLGAYGNASLPLPLLVYRLNIRGEHVMARDIDVHQVQLRGRHITLFQCTVHSMPPHRANNLVILNKYSSYTAVVGCLVYDCNSNDLISIHDSSDGPVGSHHWVVDNTIIGNAGSEQGFDFASPGGAYDVKFINNRVQCNSLPGLSTLTGSTRGGATAGKIDSFVWMVNNIITGGSGYGITTGGHNQATVGNILYDSGSASNAMLIVNTKRGDGVVVHNTVLQSLHGRAPVEFADPNNGNRTDVRVRFTHNIVGLEESTAGTVRVDLPPAVRSASRGGNTTVVAFDHNFYQNLDDGVAQKAGGTVVNKLTLAEWQAQSGFDMHSGDGDVPGVTVPDAAVWADPRDWSDPAFMSHFTPDAGWSRCGGPNTPGAGATAPGAVDCSGTRVGIGLLAPFAEFAENGGFGWAGTPIVRERYPLPTAKSKPSPTSPAPASAGSTAPGTTTSAAAPSSFYLSTGNSCPQGVRVILTLTLTLRLSRVYTV